jgi:hypothetical protein
VFANKTDVNGCMDEVEILKVSTRRSLSCDNTCTTGAPIRCNQDSQMAYNAVQRYHRKEFGRRAGMGGARCQRETVSVLTHSYIDLKALLRYIIVGGPEGFFHAPRVDQFTSLLGAIWLQGSACQARFWW